MSDRTRLTNALFLSLLAHALILALLPLWRSGVKVPELPPLLDVDVVNLAPPAPKAAARPAQPVPPPPKPAAVAPQQPAQPAPEPPPVVLPDKQIVSPPDAGEEKPPPETRLLSDRDNTVKEQQVKRGEPLPGPADQERAKPAGDSGRTETKARQPARGGQPAAPPARAARPAAPSAARNDLGLEKLLPSAQDMVRQGYGRQQAGEGDQLASAGRSGERSDLLRYGGDGWQSSSLGGTLDLLPDVREGDITLLNTKAELFAPFVRRVAIRVFQNLVIGLRHDLTQARSTTQEDVTVEAVMSRKGDMVSLQIKDRSATSTLGTDRNLQQACYQGFFDRNPPPGAEGGDGNIHFIFSTRVMAMTDPRGIAVGYRAIFQAGLL